MGVNIAPHQMRPGDCLEREQGTVERVGSTFRETEDGPLRRTIVLTDGRRIVKREGELCRVRRK